MTEEELIYHIRGGLYRDIHKHVNWLRHLLELKNQEYSNAPAGKIRIIKTGAKRSNTQYYHRRKPTDTGGKYIRKANKELIQTLVQKDFDKMILEQATEEINALTDFLSKRTAVDYDRLYNELDEDRRQWVTPLLVGDKKFVEDWLATPYQQMEIKEGTPSYHTLNNEIVRSKSEVMIANALYEHGIPYKYERSLLDNQIAWVSPDFTILNIRKRKLIYWEHFGLMDDPGYVKATVNKLYKYQQHDIFPGDNLILTFETGINRLDPRDVNEIIEHYLM